METTNKLKNKKNTDTYNPLIELACEILLQATYDYKDLLLSNADYMIDKGNKITKKELEKFFNSQWCDYLLASTNCKITGKELAKTIKNQVKGVVA